MSEVVEYIVHRPERHELVVQLTGGGAAVKFDGGMKAEAAIGSLRRLADLLERGVHTRALGAAFNDDNAPIVNEALRRIGSPDQEGEGR